MWFKSKRSSSTRDNKLVVKKRGLLHACKQWLTISRVLFSLKNRGTHKSSVSNNKKKNTSSGINDSQREKRDYTKTKEEYYIYLIIICQHAGCFGLMGLRERESHPFFLSLPPCIKTLISLPQIVGVGIVFCLL